VAGRSGAETFHDAMSLQGFTGILNTPNAEVTREGDLYAVYTNQEDRSLRLSSDKEENYLFNVGLFSLAELGGRLISLPKADHRDLSASFKVKVPFIPKGWPQVAFGMQDVGGGGGGGYHTAALLRSRYAVASQELWRFRFSVGYGIGPSRMKGAFGGGEFKVCDWLYLLGEHDTRDDNVGVRLVTPEFFGIPVRIHATAKSTIKEPGRVDMALGLTFPLGLPRHNTTPVPAAATEPAPPPGEPRGAAAAAPETGEAEAAARAAGPTDPRLATVRDGLADAGFLNVRVGTVKDRLLVVEYENARYNHNELDGLGVAAGVVVDHIPSGYRWVRFIMRKEGIRVVSFTAPLATFNEFLHDAAALADFDRELKISYDIEEDPEIAFLPGTAATSWLRSSIVLAPGLSTVIGSDYGVFDYLLSLKLDYNVTLWKGALLEARWDVPVTWSENYDDGKPLRSSRKGTTFERLMLFQTVKLAPTLMANLAAGEYLHDTYGTVNEVMWTPGSGTHRLRFKQAYLENDTVTGNDRKREAYLASYRYFFRPLDLYLEGTVGRFYNNDQGGTVELKRFFGDTAFSVYYKNTKQPGAKDRIQVGGVQFAFPLTPRRDMKPYRVQVRGSNEWAYAMETKIAENGEVNTFYEPVGINPQPGSRMENLMYNRDRLSEGYLREHLLRLRDAYIKYRE